MKKSGTIIFGRNPVRSALEAEHASLLYVSRRLSNDSLVSLARSKGIEVKIVDDGFLDHLSQNQLHQGFVAEVASYPTISLAEMIAQAKKPYPLIVILDGIEDPHNLGAILRSADAFGVDGVILKSHGEVQLNGTSPRFHRRDRLCQYRCRPQFRSDGNPRQLVLGGRSMVGTKYDEVDYRRHRFMWARRIFISHCS